ncbi:MAG: PAS domain S-box protein [Armatimonadota bacterium]
MDRHSNQHNMDKLPNNEREILLRKAVDEFPDNLFTAQVADGEICSLSVGRGVAALIGYDPEELSSDPGLWLDIVHPADDNRVRKAFARMAVSRPLNEVYRIFHKTGQMKWIRVSAVAAKDAEFYHVMGIVSDASAEMPSERLMQYKQLLDQAPTPVSLRASNGRMIYCNQAYATLIGCMSVEEAMLVEIKEIIPQDDIEWFERDILPKMMTEPWQGELRLVRKDGQIRNVSVSTNALYVSDNEPIGFYAVLTDITQRKLTEQALRESEEKYRNLVERSSDGIVVVQDLVYKFVNERFAEMVGYSVEQLIGDEFVHCITSEDAATLRDRYARRMADEKIPQIYEVQLTSSDGSKVDVEVNAGLITYEGKPADLVIFRDITQRKHDEQALRESEEKYRNLVERSNDGIAVIQDYVVKFTNERFAQMLGYSVEELIGIEFTHSLTSKNIAILQDRYARRMEGESVPQIYEVQLAAADGSKIDLEVNAGLITYEGKPADLVLFRDITQRKRDEEALRESEDKLRNLVENIDAVILRISADMRILTIGGQINNWTGLSREELIGNSDIWASFLSRQDVEKLRKTIIKASEKKTSETVEFKINNPAGHERWVRGQITPRFDAEGNLLYFDGVGLDITEQVEAVEYETRHAHLIAALVDMSQVFISTLDINKIISTAVKLTASQLNCVCSMLELDHDTGLLHHLGIYSADKDLESKVHDAFEEIGITIRDIFSEGEFRPEIFPDLMLKSPKTVEFAQRTGIKSPMSVPIYVEGELFGVFASSRTKAERPFDDEDFWFMSEVASHASAALTNAALYKRQTRIAETLQRSLIPEGISMPGQDTATSYLPAKGDVEVGGDFFDIIDFGDVGVGVIVGDVSGKGLDAAIHTAEAKYMLRGFARQNPDPGFVMTNLNYALWTYMSEFTFVTMFYALIDPKRCLMKYVNAGHECPLILCRNTRRIREICPNGIILGIERNADYNTTQIHLGSDEFLFCYTDGLIDTPYDGDRFGYDRLIEAVKRAPCTTAQELLDYVAGTVQERSGGAQTDDQVVVVVRTCR